MIVYESNSDVNYDSHLQQLARCTFGV